MDRGREWGEAGWAGWRRSLGEVEVERGLPIRGLRRWGEEEDGEWGKCWEKFMLEVKDCCCCCCRWWWPSDGAWCLDGEGG